jgi:flagellar biosynthetic protein FliP
MDADPMPAAPPSRGPCRAALWAVTAAVVLSAGGTASAQERRASPVPIVQAGTTSSNASAANAGGSIPAANAPAAPGSAGGPAAGTAGGPPPPAAAFSTAVVTPTAVAPTAADVAAGVGPALPTAPSAAPSLPGFPQVPDLSTPQNVSAAMQLIVLLTVLSLAPAILLMMTSFTRIVIVLSLLRQALGTQSLPPNQVLIGLSMFMTLLVMGPTLSAVNENALKPYMAGKDKDGQPFDQKRALAEAERPIREFMIKQIERSGNEPDVDLFARQARQPRAKVWEDVSTATLIPAFMLSELKTAFLMGFKIYLPFLIIDMVISTVLISMGMMMLPPAMISLPFKLLLFVLVNGWHLIVDNLMGSFA